MINGTTITEAAHCDCSTFLQFSFAFIQLVYVISFVSRITRTSVKVYFDGVFYLYHIYLDCIITLSHVSL